MLGFGDNGCGELFCVANDGSPRISSGTQSKESHMPAADDIADFWTGWISGTTAT